MYRFDVNHGGFGLTKDIPPEFLQGTTPEEKHLVAQWVRTALAELQEKRRNTMAERINKDELVRRLAARMHTDEATAIAWVDGIVETLYESFKDGKGVTLPGFGGFYVRPEPESWVFKFNPGQRLRALFGWSSTYSGKH
jgi:nucleoid DNA-binding protein